MKVEEVRQIAAERGLKPGKAARKELVRKIQEAEGNQQCFETGQAETCGQDRCLWRPDCR